jgi:DNA (cytosine-5)-methyltransferase 1
MSQLKFIDLFAGIGGFRIALENCGCECVFSSDWDKYAQKTYFANFGETPAGDIREIDAKSIPDFDILAAGFPCQSFSISGKQGGFEDTRGTLFFDIARIAKFHQPKLLFLENVKNLVSHDGGRTLSVILKTLNEIGYDPYYKVLDSSNFGVPQSRKRVYFVCFRKDLGIKYFEFPKPTNEKVYLKDILEDDSKTKQYVINRNDIKFFDKQIAHKTAPIQIGEFNKGGQGERIYSIEGHSTTISAYGGGAASKTAAYLINGKVRKLSPRECARLQGFPEEFKIPVSDAQAHKQFGNSVPIPVLKKIFEKIIEVWKA